MKAVWVVPLMFLMAAAVAALAPAASAHYCSSSTSCGPCVKGEEHAHSDPTGSCVSYDRDSSSGAGASAGWDGNSAEAKFTPGAGVWATLAAVAGLALGVRGRL